MAEHRYPRRWKPQFEGHWVGADYVEVHEPGGKLIAYMDDGKLSESKACGDEFRAETCSGASYGTYAWIEVFDHHDPEETKILARYERRRQFAYLKRIIREQREEIASLKKELSHG